MKNIIFIIITFLVIILCVSNCTLAGAEQGLVRYWSGQEEYDDSNGNNYEYNLTYEFFEDDTGEYVCEEVIRNADKEIISEKTFEKSDLKIKKADSFGKTITIRYKAFKKTKTFKYRFESSMLVFEDYNLPTGKKGDLFLIETFR